MRLHKKHSLLIEKTDRLSIRTFARVNKDKVNITVNKIMESIYTRHFMSTHTLSGKGPRYTKDQMAAFMAQGGVPKKKPELPPEDVIAITGERFVLKFYVILCFILFSVSEFIVNYWIDVHDGYIVKPAHVRSAIITKISTETRAAADALDKAAAASASTSDGDP